MIQFPLFARGALICGLLTLNAAMAQEPERKVPKNPSSTDAPEVKPAEMPEITKIGKTLFRMGEIEFDAKTKEIFIPSVVNKREGGPIEYLLVHENGKVHEAILTTTASPLHLQVVTKLLKHKSGFGNVFDPMLAAQEQVGTDADNGVTFSVLARWTPRGEADAKEKEQDLSEWIIDGENGEPVKPEPWTLTGSTVNEGAYMADVEGSIIAVYLDPVGILNMTRKGAHIDERWGANGNAIPEVGQKVTVVLKPEA